MKNETEWSYHTVWLSFHEEEELEEPSVSRKNFEISIGQNRLYLQNVYQKPSQLWGSPRGQPHG